MHARCFCSFLCFGINSRFLPFSLNRWCPFSLFPIENRVFGICGRHAIILVPSSTWHTPSASIIRTTEPRYVQLDTQLNILLPVGIKNHINVSNCLSYSKVVSLAKHSISWCQVLDPWSLEKTRNPVWPVSVRRASLLHRWSSVGQIWIIRIQSGTPDICITWALPKDCNTGNREAEKQLTFHNKIRIDE